MLISPPVLSQPDGSKPFIIRTDASSYALGAVLIQGEKPEEHVIEYASRLLSSAERNYSTTEREALAVVWALEKFRGYVENQEIIIASDHQPLKWLMSIKSPSGRLARWALQIQSFHPKILYTPGKSNVVADLLSRPVHDNKEFVCNLNTISIELPSRRSRDIREEQMKDEDIKKIIDCFESGRKDEDFINWTSRGYLMNQAPKQLRRHRLSCLESITSKNLSLRMSLHFRSLPRKPSSTSSDTKERKADDLGAASLQKKQEYLFIFLETQELFRLKSCRL
ncbi:Retrovirus-related Pol polyprotein from transposon 297 [Araneus ventricosus]|uniref:Retrovirus-related Pol polyprotein from transposon 297 n=1 Tax=Araneus ventricosus TaxID=182803 RepID=A0A4Y2DLE7_ARAVE|nr:Retrovirus-related Pol polyprotein from transposon 297 [Araneus ventricosus]